MPLTTFSPLPGACPAVSHSALLGEAFRSCASPYFCLCPPLTPVISGTLLTAFHHIGVSAYFVNLLPRQCWTRIGMPQTAGEEGLLGLCSSQAFYPPTCDVGGLQSSLYDTALRMPYSAGSAMEIKVQEKGLIGAGPYVCHH